MANIIVIESDAKVRQQMEQLFRELSEDHRGRFFSSPEEFEKTYFSQLTKKKTESADSIIAHPALQNLSNEHFQVITSSPLAQASAFPAKSHQLVFLPDFKLSLTDSGQAESLLGRPAKDLAPDNNLDLVIQGAFQPQWKEFLQTTQNDATASGTFAFTAPDKTIWIIHAKSQIREDNLISVDLEDVTTDVQPLIEEYQKRLEQEAEQEDELRLVSTIDMIIARTEFLKPEAKKWVEDTISKLKEFHYFPEGKSTRVILIKYEDDSPSKLDLIHPLIDDLLYLPFDRLLFLQKLDLLLKLPNKDKPRFLFSQTTNESIEMSKLTQIERLSDVGMAIRNPVPLKKDLVGHFYFLPPGAKESFELFGRVFKSVKHPDIENQYLVYFSFFGLKKDELSDIRSYLSRTPHYQSLKNDNKEAFQLNPYNLFLTDEQKRVRNIVVIDPNDENLERTVEMIESNMDRVKVLAQTSYTLFLRRQLAVIGGQQKDLSEMPAPVKVTEAQKEDLLMDDLEWTIRAHSRDLQEIKTEYKSDDQVLGHKVSELFAHPQTWLQLFRHKETESLLEECIRLSFSGVPTRHVCLMTDKEGQYKPIVLRLKPTSQKEIVALNISLPTQQQQELFERSREGLESVDALVIERSLVNEDLDEWFEQINNWINKRGLRSSQNPLPIIFMAKDDQTVSRVRLARTPTIGLHYKPVEVRALLFQLSEALNNSFTRFSFENLGWSDKTMPVHVSKDTHMEELSEFGATIKVDRPMQPGTTLFLRKSIFDNAPNKNLCARFYHYEKHPSEKGYYLCSALYFGINDQFLKQARSWLREQYASSKAES